MSRLNYISFVYNSYFSVLELYKTNVIQCIPPLFSQSFNHKIYLTKLTYCKSQFISEVSFKINWLNYNANLCNLHRNLLTCLLTTIQEVKQFRNCRKIQQQGICLKLYSSIYLYANKRKLNFIHISIETILAIQMQYA